MRMNMLKCLNCLALFLCLIFPAIASVGDTLAPEETSVGPVVSLSVSSVHHEMVLIEINFNEIPDAQIIVVETSADGELWIQEVCIPFYELNSNQISAHFNARDGQNFIRLASYDRNLKFLGLL